MKKKRIIETQHTNFRDFVVGTSYSGWIQVLKQLEALEDDL